MSAPQNQDPRPDKGLSMHEIQSWAQHHVSRIWSVVVIVLATLSGVLFFPNTSLILLGLGLIVGLLQAPQAAGLLKKAIQPIADLHGSSRIIVLAVIGVISIVLPFLWTLLLGITAGIHWVEGVRLFDLLNPKGPKKR